MTILIRDELTKIALLCEEVLTEQAEFEATLARDFKATDMILKQLEGSKGNHPVTAEDARVLALNVRQAIDGNQVNAQGIHLLMLLLLQVSLLAQQDPDMEAEIPPGAENALRRWFEHWDAARLAWKQYTS